VPRPRTIEVADRADIADVDVETVIAKRLAGEPFGVRNNSVPLRDPGRWELYEANTLSDRNMHYKMVHQLGWVPVTMADLDPSVTPESIGWQIGDGGQLVRGTHQDSRLYKQPSDVRKRIQDAKTAANMKGIGSAKAVKEAMTNAVAASAGSEAADFVHSNVSVTGSDRVTGGTA
jgi:hypothetical protein